MSKVLEKAAADILAIFDKYAKEGGDPKALEIKELKKLFKKELTMFPEKTFDQLAEALIASDKTKSIDAQEYVKLLFGLVACSQSKE